VKEGCSKLSLIPVNAKSAVIADVL